ncbi:flagellar biosynthetic protein FliO [Neobacillus sp. Marseille-QA0830]
MRIWKNWLVLLIVSLIGLLVPVTPVQAKEGTVYEQFEKTPSAGQKETVQSPETTDTSIVPYAAKFIGSFLLIIALLFVLLKYLSGKKGIYAKRGPFHALGGHALGKNRSVQMILIGETLYILGVGEDVQLIRAIPPGEEQSRLLEIIAEKPADAVSTWSAKIKKTSQQKWEELLLKKLKEEKSDGEEQSSGPNGKGGDRR